MITQPQPPRGTREIWHLRLYVAGTTANSTRALANLRQICAEHLPEAQIEVIDLVADPARAVADDVFAVPTLIRRLPTPVQRIIGDLSDTERVLVGLNVSLTEESYR
ncbi:MAG TPA: circadian clock KaiB family protein [Dermatophilaceae bacterium]